MRQGPPASVWVCQNAMRAIAKKPQTRTHIPHTYTPVHLIWVYVYATCHLVLSLISATSCVYTNSTMIQWSGIYKYMETCSENTAYSTAEFTFYKNRMCLAQAYYVPMYIIIYLRTRITHTHTAKHRFARNDNAPSISRRKSCVRRLNLNECLCVWVRVRMLSYSERWCWWIARRRIWKHLMASWKTHASRLLWLQFFLLWC